MICLEYNQIVDITTNRPYVTITLSDDQKVLINLSLLALSKNLPVIFFQCNHSSIVNLLHVSSYYKEGRFFYLHTKLGKQFRVSPKYDHDLFEKIHFAKSHSVLFYECLSCKRTKITR
ncbi:MAG: LytTR family transcriptional regulator DNA-binding domain-containing protein [Tannerella sp.]|nr:LytTR family transcriptional regulator DNA-binding domain-containing protein [Tannerella sp.]